MTDDDDVDDVVHPLMRRMYVDHVYYCYSWPVSSFDV